MTKSIAICLSRLYKKQKEDGRLSLLKEYFKKEKQQVEMTGHAMEKRCVEFNQAPWQPCFGLGAPCLMACALAGRDYE